MALDIFEQILFGNGAWLGFLILTVLCFAGIAVYKYFAIISFIIFTLLSVKYLELYSSGSNNLFWFFPLSLVVAFMQIMFMLKVKN